MLGSRGKRFGLKLQPSLCIMSVDLLLGEFLLYVELDVLGDEAAGITAAAASSCPWQRIERPCFGQGTRTNEPGVRRRLWLMAGGS